MRRTLIITSLQVFALLAIGVLLGRFLIPLVEPREVSYMAIYPPPDSDICTLHMEHVTTIQGREISRVNETESLTCIANRDFPSASIQCRCITWGKYRDAGYWSDDLRDGGE